MNNSVYSQVCLPNFSEWLLQEDRYKNVLLQQLCPRLFVQGRTWGGTGINCSLPNIYCQQVWNFERNVTLPSQVGFASGYKCCAIVEWRVRGVEKTEWLISSRNVLQARGPCWQPGVNVITLTGCIKAVTHVYYIGIIFVLNLYYIGIKLVAHFQPVNSDLRRFRVFLDDVCTKSTVA